MTKIRLISFIVLATVAGPGQTSNWWLSSAGGNSPNRLFSYVDVDSIKDTGGSLKTAWITRWFQTPQKTGESYTKLLISFNCNDNKTAILAWSDYDRAGNSLNSRSYSAYTATYNYIVPDTIGESDFKTVCEGQRRDKGETGDGDALNNELQFLWRVFPSVSSTTSGSTSKSKPRVIGGHRVQ